jgi:hypothetical protein
LLLDEAQEVVFAVERRNDRVGVFAGEGDVAGRSEVMSKSVPEALLRQPDCESKRRDILRVFLDERRQRDG